jgi:hypothetical protein
VSVSINKDNIISDDRDYKDRILFGFGTLPEIIFLGCFLGFIVGFIIFMVCRPTKTFTDSNGITFKVYADKFGKGYTLDDINVLDYDYIADTATFKLADGSVVSLNALPSPLNIANANTKSDLLLGVSDDIKLEFIKYCYTNKIHNKIEVLGYSDNNKMLSYKDLFDEAIITLTLGNNGFYQSGFESLKPYRYGVYHSLN